MIRRCPLFSLALPGAARRFALTSPLHDAVYAPPVKDYQFLMEEVFCLYRHYDKLGRPDVNKNIFDSLLDKASTLATQPLVSMYANGARGGCAPQADSPVHTSTDLAEGYKLLRDGGWFGLCHPEEFGGQGLPGSVGFVTREVMATANWPLLAYPTMNACAANVLLACGNAEERNVFVAKLLSGEWGGYVCLTEQHSEGELEHVETRAESCGGGTYRLNGTKVRIPVGDHDMVSNVIFILLARVPDATVGSSEISLFVVPRHTVKPDGTLEAEQNVKCTAMRCAVGLEGRLICELHLENSVGYLVGKPGEGLARLLASMDVINAGTAMGGVCRAELAFQNGLSYSTQRGSQSTRSGPQAIDPSSSLLARSAHVRSRLLYARAVAEGGRAFLLDVARLLDLQHNASSLDVRRALATEVGFYALIAKVCLVKWGANAALCCLQVTSGSLGTEDSVLERLFADAHATMLYDGTTRSQLTDFISKYLLSPTSGEAARFGSRVNALVRPLFFARGVLGRCARRLWMLQKQWRMGITKVKMSALQDPESIAAASEDLVMCTGYVILGYYWLLLAVAAQKRLETGQESQKFYRSKIDLCHYVFQNILPYVDAHFQMMQSDAGILKYNEAAWASDCSTKEEPPH
ncbi:Acyl CoA dehydrogenase N terminal domain [Trypanosoma vivax]|uniref:Putative acyl-CoA dehydrogenase n=1 Tax=Trypanosoma vivax (strain Y486) TaxID=1055687 RepID=G0UD85_TRYVY|nr:putative acyl-CoA dehydrogenase [Trypanosoma vivax]KAH8608885.1 Acyl CoA dehydrogenase N terminal domain [Trypanosoma vivax]CCC53796.1 putative acyl-CoA dehydrogenase [Trypanosoma vivax Y486]